MKKIFWVLVFLVVVAAVFLATQQSPTTPSTTTLTLTASTPAKPKPAVLLKVITLFQKDDGESDLAAYVSRGLAWELKGEAEFKALDAGADQELAEYYQVDQLPAVIFESAGGKILYRHEGYMSKDEIVKKLAELKSG